jgi:hypothetical protein
MSPAPARNTLALALHSFTVPPDEIRQRTRQIHQDALTQSRDMREADFTAIHPHDLEFLFAAYDRQFFGGLCREALNGRKLAFRLSRRMTQSGGTTTMFRHRAGESSFEIAIAVSMLFESFGDAHRRVTVCGLECLDRLQALQRIFEHELVHLLENLCWGYSECSAPRFQDIARRLFLHRSHRHALITRREKAAEAGIRVGSRVAFQCDGRRLEGRVNRITKRATVLVDDPNGVKFSNGGRYRTYYVPIWSLQPVAAQMVSPIIDS